MAKTLYFRFLFLFLYITHKMTYTWIFLFCSCWFSHHFLLHFFIIFHFKCIFFIIIYSFIFHFVGSLLKYDFTCLPVFMFAWFSCKLFTQFVVVTKYLVQILHSCRYWSIIFNFVFGFIFFSTSSSFVLSPKHGVHFFGFLFLTFQLIN